MFPKFYFCYDLKTHLTTVLTSDLNLAHQNMIKLCSDQGTRGVHARSDPFSFVGLWYDAIFESYRQTVEEWVRDCTRLVSALQHAGLTAIYDWLLRMLPELLRTTPIMKSVLLVLRTTVESCLLPCTQCESCKRDVLN